MDRFVFALVDGVSTAPDGALVTTARGQVWAADDPFVAQRPDLFSETPSVVHNTTGAQQLDATPLAARRTRRKASAK